MANDEPRMVTVDDAVASLRHQLADKKAAYGRLSRAEMEAIVSYFADVDDFKNILKG